MNASTSNLGAVAPIRVTSHAMDELFALREGAACETQILDATLGRRLGTACRLELLEARALLVDSIRTDVVQHRASAKRVEAFVARVPARADLSAETVDADVLACAVGDIDFTRTRMSGRPVEALERALAFSGFPASRRDVTANQVARLRSLAGVRQAQPWQGVSYRSMRHAWNVYGTGTLTVPSYVDELARRY